MRRDPYLDSCHREAMAEFELNEGDRRKLTLFLDMKFQNLVDELDLRCAADEASAEAVARAAQGVLSLYPQPPRDADVEENARELEGLVLEFRDWKGCDARDRQHMLLGQFRKLLWYAGAQKLSCKTVTVAGLARAVGWYESESCSRPFLLQLKCILRDFKGWRMLCGGGGTGEMPRDTFWRKLVFDGGSTTEDASDAEKLGPCSKEPHCDDFDERYALGATMGGKKRKLDEGRRMEYKFLFAAQDHCLRCLKYYASRPGLDIHCQSCGQNARGWAEAHTSRNIPKELEAWLRENGM